MNGIGAVINFYRIYMSPPIDVCVLSFVIYKVYKLLVKTNGIQLIKAGILVGVVYALANLLQLNALLWLLKLAAPGLLVCFGIVFQPELRKLFLKMGQSQWISLGVRAKHSHVDSVLTAADLLSEKRRGMLVIFLRHTKLDDIISTGQMVNADISSNLLVTIFEHDTPMHDGACVVQGGKLIAAGCFLPLSEQHDIKKTFGTRHRAALGVAETTDAVVLVVSEESGAISLAYDSKLYYDLKAEELSRVLGKQLGIKSGDVMVEEG